MKRINRTYGLIFFLGAISVVLASIISISSKGVILSALICFFASLISMCLYLKTKDSDRYKGGNQDKWLDLLFLLENYKVTEKNKSIVCDYINFIKSETDCPSCRLTLKINRLLEEKGLGSFRYDTSILKKIHREAAALGFLAFGVCGIFSSIIAYSFLVNPLSILFWISLAFFAVGVVIWLLCSDGAQVRKIRGIVGGAVIALSLVSVFVANGAWEEKYNSPDYIGINVTGKESTIEYGYSTKYKTVIFFTISNNCLKNIEYIEGRMVFYDGNEEIGASTVSFRMSVDPTRSSKMTVDFSGSDKVYQTLCSTSFDKMKIEYKITTIKFQDQEAKTYDKDYKVIKTAEEKKNGPFSELQDSYVGQTVTFGKYETNCDFNTTEDLEWIVVKKEGDKVLLFSKYSLISMPFGDWTQEDYVSWKNSEIRRYLNGTFYYDCFTEEEQRLIASTTNIPGDEEIGLGAVQTTDKIFIPSSDEMNEMFYSDGDMRCLSTGNIWGEGAKFGVESASYDDYNSYCSYWLRDALANAAYGLPAQCVFEETNASINPYSGIDATLTYNDPNYVRACMWVDLSFLSE